MYKQHEFFYTPIIIGAQYRYIIDLPPDRHPIRFWTITAPMFSWSGEVTKTSQGRAEAVIWQTGELNKIEGMMVSALVVGMPCFIMEHLNINGKIEYMVGRRNIMDGQRNFVNFGIPEGKHLRIDIYTGESRIING